MTTGLLAGVDLGDDRYIDIEPPRASLGQLQLTNKLQMVRIDNDVLGVAARLRSIDPGLKMMHQEVREPGKDPADVFVLYHVGVNHKGEVEDRMVGAYTELDARIIGLIERIDAQGRGRHDLATELDKLERLKDREQEAREHELYGEAAERLRSALRNDLGETGSSVQLGAGRGIDRTRAEARAAGNRAERRAAARARRSTGRIT